MDVLNKNIEDVILLEYFNILSVQLSEENEKELKIIYKDGEIQENYTFECVQVKDIVCEIYKILDLIRDSANILEVEAGILLDNCDLNNYEVSKMKVMRTSFIIEYIDIKIYDNPVLSNPIDNPVVSLIFNS